MKLGLMHTVWDTVREVLLHICGGIQLIILCMIIKCMFFSVCVVFLRLTHLAAMKGVE